MGSSDQMAERRLKEYVTGDRGYLRSGEAGPPVEPGPADARDDISKSIIHNTCDGAGRIEQADIKTDIHHLGDNHR